MTHARTTLLLGMLALAAPGCSASRTEVLLVIDTDMRVPDELDEVRVDLIGPGGETRRAEGSITSPGELPRSLAIVDRTNGARTVRLTITGLRRGGNVVQRRAVFTFVPKETRILHVDLLAGCVGVSCPSDQTCGENGCRALAVGAEELVPYDPASVHRMDASADAGSDASPEDGGCLVVTEVCNELDDDCDELVDEDFDLAADTENCGRCANACPLAPSNAASACEAGSCVLRCDRGFDDCDGVTASGCEASLSAPASCGDCDTTCEGATPFCEEGLLGSGCVESCTEGLGECAGACVDTSSDPRYCGECTTQCAAPPNAVATCSAGACGFECDLGFADCDARAENGCESTLREAENCGRCGVRCARPGAVTSCATGSCQLLGCERLRGDCDRDPSNGCEEDLSTNLVRCGACMTACPSDASNATVACVSGSCEVSCFSGFGNCDSILSNGCEQSLASTAACGVCGVGCSGTTPLCEAVSGGGYACTSGCTSGTVCGSSCVSTATDALHCGSCERVCASGANAIATCTASSCGITCVSGFADCDTDGASCESALGSAASCGSCTNVCPRPPNSVPTCRDGACGYGCQAGFDDCNGTEIDGCEIDLSSDVSNCGRCSNRCVTDAEVAEVACVAGLCEVVSCTPPDADCDGTYTTGCEVNTSINRSHCGVCENACGSGRRCCDGTCRAPSLCP